jgi:hypothetical protein
MKREKSELVRLRKELYGAHVEYESVGSAYALALSSYRSLLRSSSDESELSDARSTFASALDRCLSSALAYRSALVAYQEYVGK